MYIPLEVLKKGDFSKFQKEQRNRSIFKDKSVSKLNSPLLYNIELGLSQTEVALNGNVDPKRQKVKSSSRQKSAKKLLNQINIVRVNIPKDFSLIQDVAAAMAIDNPNIADESTFKNTFNDYIVATDKFPFAEDPFYKFDAGNMSAVNYVEEKGSDNVIMEKKDMSKIASGMVSLNMLEKYKGQSKYFIKELEWGTYDG